MISCIYLALIIFSIAPHGGAFCCDSYRIQTCNLLIRSQMLYSVELMSHARFLAFATAKLNLFSETAKFFCEKKLIEEFFR